MSLRRASAGLFRPPPSLLLFLALWIVTQATLLLVQNPGILTGSQLDSDGYMRLVRVERLAADPGTWFDGSIPRSNWPFGEEHHWTRPLDLLILALALPLRLLFAPHEAMVIAGTSISSLCHLATCLAAVWVVRPLVPGSERILAMPAMLVQPGLLAYGSLGRADHHALLLLLFVLALGAWIRALLMPERTAPPLAAGALSALGIWVSPESLLPLVLLLAGGGLAWLIDGRRMRPPNLLLAAGLSAGLAAAIPLQHPPNAWPSSTADQISVSHLTMALLVLGFWYVIGATPRLHGISSSGWRARLALGGAAAVVAVGIQRLVHPRFFRGPWSEVDPEVIGVWLRHVRELQPLLPSDATGLGPFLMHLGPALVLVPVVSWWIRNRWTDRRRNVWILLLISLLVYIPLSAAQLRFSGYVGGISAIASVELLRRLLMRGGDLPIPARHRLARVALMTTVLLGGLLVGAAADAFTGGTDAHSADEAKRTECSLSRMAPFLNDPDGLGAAPRTIAAHIDFGPELLYRTPHRILAGPYHRNRSGILAAYHLLSATDTRKALALAREREVDLILLCPAADRAYFGRGGPASLYARIVAGSRPGWLSRLALPPDAPSGFLLFHVDRNAR